MAVKLDIDPTWIKAVETSPGVFDVEYNQVEMRALDSGLLAHNADPIAPMAGVIHGMNVTVDAARVATVQQGSAVLAPNPVSATLAGYRAVVAGVLPSEELDAPDGTYSRRDIVCLEIRDPDISGSEKGAFLVTVAGSPDPSPVAPTPAAGQLLLAEVLVPVSGAPTVIDRRRFTSAAGAIIPCTSVTRPASGPHLRPGQAIFETDTGVTYVWSGSAWQRLADKTTDTGIVKDFTFASGWGRMPMGADYPATGWRIKDGWATFSLQFRALGSTQPFLKWQWRKVATSAGFRPPTEAMFILRQVVGGSASGYGTVSVSDGSVYVSADADINMAYQDEFILTMVPYRV